MEAAIYNLDKFSCMVVILKIFNTRSTKRKIGRIKKMKVKNQLFTHSNNLLANRMPWKIKILILYRKKQRLIILKTN